MIVARTVDGYVAGEIGLDADDDTVLGAIGANVSTDTACRGDLGGHLIGIDIAGTIDPDRGCRPNPA